VDRSAALVWVVDDADSLGAALASLSLATPTAVLLGGTYSPDLTDPALTDAAVDAVEQAIEESPRRVDIAVSFAALPPGATSVCIDRFDPLGDPLLADRADGLQAWLRSQTHVDAVVIDFNTPPRAWEVDCACAACESTEAGPQAVRLTTLFDLYREPAGRESVSLWWWDAGTSADVNVGEFMDLALLREETDRHLPLRLMATRGPLHPWGRDNPLIDGRVRRVAVDLDPAGQRFGPGDVPLFQLDELNDRMRRNREARAVGWFVDVTGPHRSAAGDLAGEAALRFIETLYRSQGAEPLAVLTEHLEAEVGVGEPLHELAIALRGTGRALDLVRAPLGIETEAFDQGLPNTLPLPLVTPTDSDWAPRRAQRMVPSREDTAAIHQWTAEADAILADALASLDAHEAVLEPAGFTSLRRGTRTLQAWVEAWAMVVNVDAAWRRGENADGPDRDEAHAWLRGDVVELRALADGLDAGLLADEFTSPFPVDTASLRAIADLVDAELGPGTAEARPFPVLRGISASQNDNRYTVSWEVTPPAGGSVEWGTAWPTYDDGGSGEESAATRWSAWRELALTPNSRVTYRVCTPYEDALGSWTICSSDHALWTDR
jgi:hypothetical protein